MTPARQHRFHLLDALRAIAAVLVVFFHAPGDVRPGWLSYPNSYLAVDFFFCLSGFVVAFSYEDRLKASMTLRDFFSARVIRLYPLYLLGSTLVLLHAIFIDRILRMGVSASTLEWIIAFAVFLIPNLFLNYPQPYNFPLNHPAWSLFFELFANGAFAWLIRKRLGSTAMLLLLTALSFGGLAAIAMHPHTLDVGDFHHGFWLCFPRVGFSFLAGVLLFRLYCRGSGGGRSPSFMGLGSALTVLMLVGALTLKTRWTASTTYALAVVTLLFPALVYLGAHCRIPPLLIPACVVLGDMSYPIYMLHIGFFNFLYGGSIQRVYTAHARPLPALLPVFVCLLILLAWWIGAYVDLPLRKKLNAVYKQARRPKPRPELSTS